MRFDVAIHFSWSWIVGCNIWLPLRFITFFLCHFRTKFFFLNVKFYTWIFFQWVKWTSINLSLYLFIVVLDGKKKPLSWAPTVRLFHDLISFNASFFSFDMFGRTFLKHFSLLLCQIYLFLCFQQVTPNFWCLFF